MKTKELIRLLQKHDPSGEEHVCVNNVDIRFIENAPAYWDGPQQIIIQDEKGQISGGKYNRTGSKIQIHTSSFSTLVWDRPDFPIDYSDLDERRQNEYKTNHNKIRDEAKDFEYKLELEYFTKFIKDCAAEIMENDEDLNDMSKEFYDDNFTPDDPFPDDIPWLGESYHSRRIKYWSSNTKVTYNGFGFEIERRHNEVA